MRTPPPAHLRTREGLCILTSTCVYSQTLRYLSCITCTAWAVWLQYLCTIALPQLSASISTSLNDIVLFPESLSPPYLKTQHVSRLQCIMIYWEYCQWRNWYLGLCYNGFLPGWLLNTCCSVVSPGRSLLLGQKLCLKLMLQIDEGFLTITSRNVCY